MEAQKTLMSRRTFLKCLASAIPPIVLYKHAKKKGFASLPPLQDVIITQHPPLNEKVPSIIEINGLYKGERRRVILCGIIHCFDNEKERVEYAKKHVDFLVSKKIDVLASEWMIDDYARDIKVMIEEWKSFYFATLGVLAYKEKIDFAIIEGRQDYRFYELAAYSPLDAQLVSSLLRLPIKISLPGIVLAKCLTTNPVFLQSIPQMIGDVFNMQNIFPIFYPIFSQSNLFFSSAIKVLMENYKSIGVVVGDAHVKGILKKLNKYTSFPDNSFFRKDVKLFEFSKKRIRDKTIDLTCFSKKY